MKLIQTLTWLLFAFSSSIIATESSLSEVSIKSEHLQQHISFKLNLPDSYNEQPNKRYPVFITTAGASRLTSLFHQVKWLSHVDFAPIPEVIFITLPNIDLSATQTKLDVASGNLDEISANVLINDVLMYIDKNYRTTQYRIVEGFSSAGNLPLYLLRNHSDSFNAFFIFSPALELDKSELVSSFSDDWQLADNKSHFVYLSLGSFSGNKAPFKELKNQLSKFKTRAEIHFADLSKENYLATPNIGLISAATLNFADLQPNYEQFHTTGIEGVTKYFSSLANKYDQEIDITSKLVSLGFSYAAANKSSQAIETMEYASQSEPNNTLLHVRYGQILMQLKEQTLAKTILSKALSLANKDNNSEAVNYITNLLSQVNN